jgi:hypothetical protein
VTAEGPELLEVVHLGGTTFFSVVGQRPAGPQTSRGHGRLNAIQTLLNVDSTSFAPILREGLRSQGASCAVGGSGEPPYEFLNLNDVFNSRFSTKKRLRNGSI